MYLCICWIIKCIIVIDARYKHEDFFISVVNQLDAQNFCFTVSLFHASTCFEHMCSSSGCQNLHYTATGIITPIDARNM